MLLHDTWALPRPPVGQTRNLEMHLPKVTSQVGLPFPASTPRLSNLQDPRSKVYPEFFSARECALTPPTSSHRTTIRERHDTMAPKREADDAFIKADPDAKRVKRESGAANVSLASIPMAPSSSTALKAESKEHKPLDSVGLVPVKHLGQCDYLSSTLSASPLLQT